MKNIMLVVLFMCGSALADMDSARRWKSQQLSIAHANNESGGLSWTVPSTSQTVIINTDSSGVVKIATAVQLAAANDQFTVQSWRCKDAATDAVIFVDLTNADLLSLAAAYAAHVQAGDSKLETLQSQLDTAVTPSDVSSIRWEE